MSRPHPSISHGSRRRLRRLTAVVLLLLSAPLLAADGVSALQRLIDQEPEFLPVDRAFRMSHQTGSDGALLVRWEMPDGYYLYRHAFGFQVRAPGSGSSPVTLAEPEIPPGLHKVDEYFGEVEVYYHEAQARVPVQAGAGAVEVGISYQGCADAGLCYPPETRWVAMSLAAPGAAGPASPAGSGGIPQTAEQSLAARLASGSMALALLLFFLGGIALAFTPCVLPMVPILSSIIVGQAAQITRARAFSLSLAYVLGMAATYAVVGTLVGLFGASLNLQAALQSPPVLVGFAAVFVALSLAMFGFYDLRLPQRWQEGLDRLGNRAGGGKHLGVVVMGALSALVVSPCVSAPLAGALVYISATGDAVLGGAALLALGLGMGVPLLLIGASGGHLLPRAGAWMNGVKAVFGVGLLAVAVWLLERVVPASATLALWAALAIGCGVYLGALDFSPRSGMAQLRKAGGAFSFIYGVLLLIGAASGGQDPLRPLSVLGEPALVDAATQGGKPGWIAVSTLDDVHAELARARQAGRPAILDLYADWCISCKVMERSVFPQPEVDAHLRRFHLLRADVTRNNADDKALLQAFGLFGPPSLVFFADDGEELRDARIQGEIGATALSRHLQAVLEHEARDTAAVAAANAPFIGR